ncbi:hypothetical protein ACFFSY_33475 [Paenibacillus aurantiacus]|uniref:Uncharacterized protein n=1 Tax=Paenibacillus aurantiacus TaxID=1936118 RepID=A0ABV5L068_9BACL
MRLRLKETDAGWIFLISYFTGILLTAYMTMNGGHHHDNPGLFLHYVAVGQIALNALPAVLWMLQGLTEEQGPTFYAVLLTGAASVAAFFACRWLLGRMNPMEGPGHGQPEAGSPLRARLAWLLPIVIAVVIFVVKYAIS